MMHRKPLFTLRSIRGGLLMASSLLFSAAPLLAERDALLQILLEEGVLTSEQAAAVEESATTRVTPNRGAISELRVRGRIQPQFGYARGENAAGQSGDYATFEIRRARLGVTGRVGEDWRFVLEANTTPSDVNLQFASLRWEAFPEANLVLGFDRPVFGYEIYTSSAFLLTPERSNLSATFLPSSRISLTGAQIQGTSHGFRYSAGIYNSDLAVNESGESARFLFGGHIGRDLPEWGGVQQEVRFDYLQNEREDRGLLGVNRAFSASHRLVVGSFENRSEGIWGESFGGDDVAGFYLMPTWSLNEQWQLVARYENIRSWYTGGLAAPNRYLRRIDVPGGAPRGDRYEALYGGINYYIMGHDLKMQWGVEWSDLEDTRSGEGQEIKGLTTYGAMRMLF